MRIHSLILAAALSCALFAAAAPAAPRPEASGAFAPIATGTLGELMAKDGDAMFYAEYFAAPAPQGEPVASRLEPSVGSGQKPDGLGTGGYSARWTTTITPGRSGRFPLALRSTGASVVKLDGKILIARTDNDRDFDHRSLGFSEMESGKPYEMVVEFRDPTGTGRISVEWSPPTQTSSLPRSKGSSAPDGVAGPEAGTTIGPAIQLHNRHYSLESQTDGNLRVTDLGTGATAVFAPTFEVVAQPPGRQSKLDAKGGQYHDESKMGDVHYLVPSWDKETDFLIAAHPRTRLRASAVRLATRTIEWSFPAQATYTLSAAIELPDDNGEPNLSFHLTPIAGGQFSVGYLGAPTVAPGSAAWFSQPLIWQGKRFPNHSFLTKEFECPLPMVMVGVANTAIGVGADPKEMPFRMPTSENSRFGILLRNAAGQAQPMLFAPVLGGPESRRSAGQSYDFTLRLFVGQGAWYGNYRQLALGLYQFADVRENGLCSLNTTIENLLDFILTDRFSYWFPRYKTWGYQNDGGPGAGRQQSAADAISLALVSDSPEFYERRSLPTLEYMLSRHSVSTKMEEPDFMGGFVKNASDLSAAYRLTGGRSTVIRSLLESNAAEIRGPQRSKLPGRNSIAGDKAAMLSDISYYRLTGERHYLDEACIVADRYIAARVAQPASSFRDQGSSFWTELSPPYESFYALYQDTGQRKYLAAAAAAMHEFTAYPYLVPVIPAGNFTANPGGRYNGQPVPEETVPAWRVAANGLAAECAATAHSHRGVFMASYAAYMVKLARDTNDDFLRDIARSAIVGRYANYPSYAYRNGYSTVYEKPDYPLQPFEGIKRFTSAHYNHPVPMAAFLVDYLVGDIYDRSAGQITFPSDYTNTGAYFHNQVYGARPGSFYGEKGVFLWLPKRLVKADSIQFNYVAGYGNGRLYLALSNQSSQPIVTTLQIDPARVGLAGSHRIRRWIDNAPAADAEMTDGKITVAISAKGLTCLAADDAAVHPRIQQAMHDPASPALPAGSSQSKKTGFGEVTATALRFGRGLTTVHVWLTAGPDQAKRVRLNYTAGEKSDRLETDQYPFEFTVPVPDSAATFRCTVEADTPGGGSSADLTLQLASGPAQAAIAAEPIRVACSTYTFHTSTVFEAVEKAAATGVHYVETFTNQKLSPTDPTKIYELSADQVALLRAHLAKNHVAIASCMLGLPKDEAKARALFERVRQLGATNIGTDSVESIDTAEKLAKEYDMTVAFHNHPADPKRPSYQNSDPHFMLELLKGRDPHVGACTDIGHYATSGVVPLDGVKLLAGRIKSIHLKERSAIGRRTPDQVYGTGISRIGDVLAELRRQHFTGLIVIEYESNPKNNLQEVKQCVAFLREDLGASFR